MRVCHILFGFYPWNPDPYEYTRRLAALGLDVDIVAISQEGQPAREVVDGVHVTRLALGSDRFSARSAYYFALQVMSLLSHSRYDVVHVYVFRSCFLLPLLRRRAAKKWLLHIQSGNVSGRWYAALADKVTALEARFFDRVVALDETVGRRILGARRPFRIVPLGADFDKFRPGTSRMLGAQLGFDDRQIVLVFSGKMKPQRRLETLLDAFALARNEFGDLRLLMIGGGDSLDALRNRATSLGIDQWVHFTGHVAYEEVQSYVNAGDIALAYVPILPQYERQPPLKTVEFLASGLPTIATATKGNALFIQHEENGLLVNDDPDSFAEGMLRLVRDSTLREELARNARPSVLEYDWRRIVKERLLPVYEQLLESVG